MTRKNILIYSLAGLGIIPLFFLNADLSLYLNPAGLVLVLGGTLTGIFLAYPMETLRGLWSQVKGLGQDSVLTQAEIIELFVRLARIKRAQGVRALEKAALEFGNPFLEMGVVLAADERPREDVRDRLEQEFDFFMSRRESELAALNLMGRLAPALGLAGTVVGLIRMLHQLKDPGTVAAGMSVALLATFYGVLLANLIVLPLERKLRERNRAEAVTMTLITEGIMGLCNEDNGAAMHARLSSYRFAQPQPRPVLGVTGRGLLGSIKTLAPGSATRER